mmetsp:Transcript_22416/g.34560  ORF Transcript_22416/g.34560 Transcript_22416/m.34560 type:complete len:429 (+) Transcript_22416:115-1401(+)
MGPGFILAILFYILVFVFFLYVCMVADPSTSKLAEFWSERVPNYIGTTLQNAIGEKAMKNLSILSEHFLQIVYLVVVLGAWSVMFAHGYPWITSSTYVSDYHKWNGYVVFLLCMSSYRYACNVSPGYITERTLAKYDHYPFDNLLYIPNRICPTVGIVRLARSKYDRFTKVHIARFDHFCGWLNQGVGEENYRYFLWFLLVHVLMCIYGAGVISLLFYGEIFEKDLLNATFYDVATGREVKADWTVVAIYMFRARFTMAANLLLMTVMAALLGSFLGWHIWITSRGMTTNESFKWSDVKRWHKQEKKRYEEALKAGLPVGNIHNSTMSSGESDIVSDGDIACTGPTSTPIKSQSTVSSTESERKKDAPIYDPGPFPKNIYNKGFIENWKEVFFPRSLRQDALDRWNASLQKKRQKNETDPIPDKPKVS